MLPLQLLPGKCYWLFCIFPIEKHIDFGLSVTNLFAIKSKNDDMDTINTQIAPKHESEV